MKPIAWRWYDHETDKEQVEALHHSMEQKIGQKLDLPNLSDTPIIGCVVGETDGKITHGVFLEAEVEVCALGANPLSKKAAQDAVELLMPVLDFYNIRIARSFVPIQLLQGKRGRLGAVGRLLKGMKFVQEGAQMTSWFRWIGNGDVS